MCFFKLLQRRCRKCFADPVRINPLDAAIRNDHLHCFIQAFHDHPIWSLNTATTVAMYGRLDMLKFAREHGCPWDESVCTYSAKFGHITCLKYAHENGCHWDEHTILSCLYLDNLDCLIYAHTHGCPHPTATSRLGHLTQPLLQLAHPFVREYYQNHTIINNVCICCTLQKQDFTIIPWTSKELWQAPIAWKYLKARLKILRAAENAHWNPAHTYCCCRLLRDFQHLQTITDISLLK